MSLSKKTALTFCAVLFLILSTNCDLIPSTRSYLLVTSKSGDGFVSAENVKYSTPYFSFFYFYLDADPKLSRTDYKMHFGQHPLFDLRTHVFNVKNNGFETIKVHVTSSLPDFNGKEVPELYLPDEDPRIIRKSTDAKSDPFEQELTLDLSECPENMVLLPQQSCDIYIDHLPLAPTSRTLVDFNLKGEVLGLGDAISDGRFSGEFNIQTMGEEMPFVPGLNVELEQYSESIKEPSEMSDGIIPHRYVELRYAAEKDEQVFRTLKVTNESNQVLNNIHIDWITENPSKSLVLSFSNLSNDRIYDVPPTRLQPGESFLIRLKFDPSLISSTQGTYKAQIEIYSGNDRQTAPDLSVIDVAGKIIEQPSYNYSTRYMYTQYPNHNNPIIIIYDPNSNGTGGNYGNGGHDPGEPTIIIIDNTITPYHPYPQYYHEAGF